MTAPADRECRTHLRRTSAVLVELARLHRRGRFHGGVCPEAVRVGVFGVSLRPPGWCRPPVDYRDPERARTLLRDPKSARLAEPRNDLFGVGALLYAWLEGTPPLCGPASPFARSVPPAAAWIAHRAMAEGPRRYPDARAMRRDVDHLLRAGRRQALAEVRPEELPSWPGGTVRPSRPLRPFHTYPVNRMVPPRRRWLAAAALLLIAVFVIHGRDDATEGSRPESVEPGLRGLVVSWREQLDQRLRAAGEELSVKNVPLLVLADVPVSGDLHWPVHPSRPLRDAVRGVLHPGISAAEVQRVLIAVVGEETLPAVLWVTSGEAPGEVRARLYYRGVALTGSVSLASSAATAVFFSPRRSMSDMKPM